MFLSYVGVGFFATWAEREKILDIPNTRSTHLRPTPRGAGLVIVGLTLLGLWVHHTLATPERPWRPLAAFTVAGLLIAIVSWCDDVSRIPAVVRLATHGIGAGIVLLGLGYWRAIELPVVGELELGWFGIPITFLWIVGLINAINFMDGIDGIAGGHAAIAASTWAVVGWLSGEPILVVLGVLLASSSLGFLGHNRPPARVFMGDTGSAFLGYSLSVLPLFITAMPPWSIVTAALMVWPFVFDSGFTLWRRISHGENILAAHRSHLYQRLVLAGWAHRSVTLLYIGMALISSLLALAWSRDSALRDQMVIVGSLFVSVILWSIVRRQERRWATRRS